jgi:polysaccharide deacetylase family protein (PEP-CTERM system associated)
VATSELTRLGHALSGQTECTCPPQSLPATNGSSCILSVDVEDWFHILDLPLAPGFSEWDSLPSHVEKNFLKLLDLFSQKNARVTCFFLGWVAKRFPHLVKEATQRGHEIASHGYAHRLVYQMTYKEFFEDVVLSKEILEDIAGRPVLGFRSPGFSVTTRTPWFFDRLAEAGYRYDSSVFPSPRGHGGIKTDKFFPHVIRTQGRDLLEFPITIAKVFGKPVCFFGGGYLRLFPYSLIKVVTARVLGEGRPVVFYVHPREVDPSHPRLPMSVTRYFKSYVNLKTTQKKLERLLTDFEMTTFEDFIARHDQALRSQHV